MNTVVDLTVVLNEATPVYPGDARVAIAQAGKLKDDGYADHTVAFNTHVGTHIDAPAHMVDGGATLDETPISRFFGRGKYIKLESGIFSLQQVKDARLSPGDIAIFHTGMQDKYINNADAYFNDYPQMSQEIAQHLIDAGVSMVGFDMCSPDHPDFPIHRQLLGAGVLIIENLTNLQELDGKEFEVTALPLKLELDGSPARVIARIG